MVRFEAAAAEAAAEKEAKAVAAMAAAKGKRRCQKREVFSWQKEEDRERKEGRMAGQEGGQWREREREARENKDSG